MSTPKIAIIGAGPAGLTLARLLQQNNILCTIYEADPDRHVRNQGGTLDLHPKAGQRALQEAGLLPEFQKYCRPEGDKDKVVGANGHIYWDDNQITDQLRPSDDPGKPEIDRTILRNILLDSIKPERIQWNHKIIRVESTNNGKSTLHFANGTSESSIDLLIGADGAWSKVRPLLTDIKPFYSGITMAELWSEKVSTHNPTLSKYIGEGSLFMFDEGRVIISQRMGDDSIRTYAGLRKPETWKDECGIDWNDPSEARSALVEQFYNDCSPDLQHTILSSHDGLVVRQLYMLPVGITWQHKPGVTLIGDAAHLMTPFAGVGVNLAMTDALVLARALIEKKDGMIAKVFSDEHNINSAIKKYEGFMFEHARENAEKTERGLKGHFSAGGARERAEKFLREFERVVGRRLEEGYFDH